MSTTMPSIQKQESMEGRGLNRGSEAKFQTLSSLSLGLVICEMMAGVVASQGSQTKCWRASTSEGSWCGKWGTLGSTPLQPGQFCFPPLYTLAAMESFI